MFYFDLYAGRWEQLFETNWERFWKENMCLIFDTFQVFKGPIIGALTRIATATATRTLKSWARAPEQIAIAAAFRDNRKLLQK